MGITGSPWKGPGRAAWLLAAGALWCTGAASGAPQTVSGTPEDAVGSAARRGPAQDLLRPRPPDVGPEVAGPNVLIILLDDLDYVDLGTYGPTVATPRLDQVAAEGLRFTQFYAGGAVCSPSRLALFTGRHPAEFGIMQALPPTSHRGLPASVRSLADLFAWQGYHTGHIGKWHLGLQDSEGLPSAAGFDRVVRLEYPRRYFDFALQFDGGPPVRYDQGQHLTEVLTDEAIAFLQQRPTDRPFYLQLWHLAPHAPLDPPQDFDNFPGYDLSTEQGRFRALATHVDQQIGRLLDELASLGLEDDTLVIVTSDNGGLKSVHANVTRPVRGFKGDVSEGGIRVPTLVRWPAGLARPGTEVHDVVTVLDVFPTLAEILGVDVSGEPLRGVSFADLLVTGAAHDPPAPLVWMNKSARIFFDPPSGIFDTYAVRQGAWKLVFADEALRLYDVESDPSETGDLAQAFPAVVDQLQHAYRAWRADVGTVRLQPTLSPSGVWRNGEVLVFDDGSGRVELGPDERLDFHDGDFTFLTRVAPAVRAGRHTIAERPGSWHLWIEGGALLLRLEGAAGDRIQLIGPQIVPHRDTHVGFTVYGWRDSPSTVRLYVDGDLAQEVVASVDEVAPSNAPIFLGNDAAGTAPFRGRIDLPLLSVLPLEASEVRAEANRVGVRPDRLRPLLQRRQAP